MQAPPDFSFGITAYHCNLYIIHKCGLLTEGKSGNLIPNVFVVVVVVLVFIYLFA